MSPVQDASAAAKIEKAERMLRTLITSRPSSTVGPADSPAPSTSRLSTAAAEEQGLPRTRPTNAHEP